MKPLPFREVKRKLEAAQGLLFTGYADPWRCPGLLHDSPSVLFKQLLRMVKEFAVLLYEEFIALQERLAEVEDLLDLRAAKKSGHDASAISLADVESRFGDAS